METQTAKEEKQREGGRRNEVHGCLSNVTKSTAPGKRGPRKDRATQFETVRVRDGLANGPGHVESNCWCEKRWTGCRAGLQTLMGSQVRWMLAGTYPNQALTLKKSPELMLGLRA